MSAITMDGTFMETMDGINPGEASITMDFVFIDMPIIGKDIQSNPKKGKLIL